MTEEEASLVKAASIGLTQSLINRGATMEEAAKIALAYAHPSDGLLVKRAAALDNMKRNIHACINYLRGN